MSSKVKLVVPEAPVPATGRSQGAAQVRAGRPAPRRARQQQGQCRPPAALHRRRREGAGPVASVVILRKDSVSLPAPDEMLDQLAEEADFVVSAMAD